MHRSRVFRLVIATALSTTVGSCKDSPTAPLDRIANIAAQSPVTVTATVSTVVAPAPTVRLTDSRGRPVAGVDVAFAVIQGGGRVSLPLVATDSRGLASVDWTIGATASTNVLRVSAGSLNPVAFTAQGLAGPVTVIGRISGDSQIGTVGSQLTFPLKARVADAYGNPVAGASVTFTVVSGGGTLSDLKPVSDSAGLVTAGSWTLGPTAGVQQVRAEVNGVSDVFTADAVKVTVPDDSDGFGTLLFSRGSDNQLYRIKIDGSGLSKLTSDGYNFSAVWSADGRRIAFIKQIPGSNNSPPTSDIYLMDADGSNTVRRTSGGQYLSVAFSPDGTKLAAARVSGFYTDISVMSTINDNSTGTLIASDGGAPAWSPDGKSIAYIRGTGYYDLGEVFIMNADGTGVRRLNPPSSSYSYFPAWSPDGKKISYTDCSSSCKVYSVNADGSGARAQLSTSDTQGGNWSPDGAWLAVTVYSNAGGSIGYIPSEGGVPRIVFAGGNRPAWRPTLR